jgi:hypothetical protein
VAGGDAVGDHPVEDVERRASEGPGPLAGFEAGDRPLEHQAVVAGLGQARLPVGGAERLEVLKRVPALRRRFEKAAKALKSLQIESLREALPIAEHRVDDRRGAAGLGGDPAHGQTVGTIAGQQVDGDVQQFGT